MPDLATLDDLIARVREATGPDRALDLALAECFAPDIIVLVRNREDTANERRTHWRYTQALEAAIGLTRRVLPTAVIRGCYGPDFTAAQLVDGYGLNAQPLCDEVCLQGEDPARALLLCLLLAKRAQIAGGRGE